MSTSAQGSATELCIPLPSGFAQQPSIGCRFPVRESGVMLEVGYGLGQNLFTSCSLPSIRTKYAGHLWPHHSWREMHQSWMLSDSSQRTHSCAEEVGLITKFPNLVCYTNVIWVNRLARTEITNFQSFGCEGFTVHPPLRLHDRLNDIPGLSRDDIPKVKERPASTKVDKYSRADL